jgi:hypothetical protein
LHRPDDRLAIRHRHLLSPPPAHLQPGLGVQPLDALVIDALAGLAELQIDHPRAVAPMALRERHDARPQRRVAIRRGTYRNDEELVRTTVNSCRSLRPRSTMLRTRARRAGAVTTFGGGPRA